MTRAPACRAASADRSVDASSTTTTSAGGSDCAKAEATASATVRSALRQGTMTLTRMNRSVYRAGGGAARRRMRYRKSRPIPGTRQRIFSIPWTRGKGAGE